MNPDSLIASWLVEALTKTGPTTTPLQVAQQVWAHHEDDLRSAGDTLFTWQLDLRAAAEAMSAEGTLTIEDNGDWSLTAGNPRPTGTGAWSEAEIAIVVEGYMEMLHAEHAGQPVRRRQVEADITARTGRSGDRLEGMLSNISAVLQEHDIAPLSSVRPRSNIPAGVRQAVAAALER